MTLSTNGSKSQYDDSRSFLPFIADSSNYTRNIVEALLVIIIRYFLLDSNSLIQIDSVQIASWKDTLLRTGKFHISKSIFDPNFDYDMKFIDNLIFQQTLFNYFALE